MNRLNSVTITAAILGVIAGIFQLQNAEAAEAAKLEEVIVTAQKREQSLQDVSLAVTAISSDTLDDYGMQSWDDIEMPGVHIGQGARNESLFVRGVGSGVNFGFEQSVPIYIDGTYYGRARAEKIGFLDADRIEVLKGPQSTYFGKNAIAGAINISSRRPTDEFEGTLELNHEFEHNENTFFGALSGPVTDNFKLRAAVKYSAMDGWMKNRSFNNQEEPDSKNIIARVSAIWDVTESLEVFAKFEHIDSETEGRNNQITICPSGSHGATYLNPALEDCNFDEYRSSSIDPSTHPINDFTSTAGYRDTLDVDGGSVTINWDINDYELTSLTSYYELDFRIPQNDVDTTHLDIGTILTTDSSDQLSQEFRVLSPRGERLEWVAGFYYDTGDLDLIQVGDLFLVPAFWGRPVSVQAALDQHSVQDSESWAVFGEAAFNITDPVTLKLGLRYTEVKKEVSSIFIGNTAINGHLIGVPPPPFPSWTINGNRKDTNFQPSVTLEWRPEGDNMFYVSWKEGFKAGGFDTDALTLPASGTTKFEPEEVTAYEIGARLRLLDGAATLNLTAFHSEYTNLQVAVFTGIIGFNTANAGESTSKGVEIEGARAASEYLTLNAALTWLDAQYDVFPGAGCYFAQTEAEGCIGGFQDMAGADLQFAPDWSGSVGGTYRRPLEQSMFGSPLEFQTRVDVFYTGDYFTDNDRDPNVIQDSFAKIDVRIGIAAQDGKWELAFIGRNLTDEFVSHWISDAQGNAGSYQRFLDRTRQLGLQYRMNF